MNFKRGQTVRSKIDGINLVVLSIAEGKCTCAIKTGDPTIDVDADLLEPTADETGLNFRIESLLSHPDFDGVLIRPNPRGGPPVVLARKSPDARFTAVSLISQASRVINGISFDVNIH